MFVLLGTLEELVLEMHSGPVLFVYCNDFPVIHLSLLINDVMRLVLPSERTSS